MNFIKTNAHWLLLTTTAIGSVAATALLLKDVGELPKTLEKFQPKQVSPKKPAPIDLSGVEAATKLISTPGQWDAAHPSLLFVSEPYLLEADGPKRPKEGSLHKHSKTGAPIPNSWFLQYKLALRTSRIALEDTDADGFTNEEEWASGTDPTAPGSHPPLVTKLYFVGQKETHNRISFLQYLGDTAKPETLKLTVRRDDSPKKSQSDIKIGDTIPETEIKLVSFTLRQKSDSGVTGSKVDGSLINLLDGKSGDKSDAEIKGKPADFVDKTVNLRLNYPKETREFTLKPGQTFTIGTSETYKLVDSSATGATLKNTEDKEFQVRPAQSE
jgi:hypothetical protein